MLKVALLVLIASIVYADLPVHCVRHQIVGRWKLYLGAPQLNGMGQLSCGHDVPDNEKSSYQAGWHDFKSSSNLDVVLTEDYDVKRVGEDVTVGKWTMVYDEGFEIQYHNTRYLAFNKYEPTGGSQATSYCDKTLIGWYNNRDNNDRGCYYAEKSEKVEQTSTAGQKVSVVQPSYMSDDQLHLLNMIQIRQTDESVNRELSREEHEEIVSKINTSGMKWEAKVYDHLVGKSFAQINKRAGRKKYFQGSTRPTASAFVQTGSSLSIEDMPKEFDWKQYIKPARSQEECGSCYTIAAMAMLSSRLRRQGQDVTLSVQHSLNCNYYNQGCDGGYPFLVNKWAQEEYLISEQDEPYQAKDGQCDMGKVDRATKVYGVRDYRYIGGGYGKGSEREIMQELVHNGPVIMNFEPTFEFMYYTKGIYHSKDADWVQENSEQPEWEKVDHSVLCYGWGEENGEKYWMLQNSWGTDWGEDGNFRMKRGVDESAIESMAEAADPIALTKPTKSVARTTTSDLLITDRQVDHIGFSFVQQKQNLRKAE